MDGKKRKKRRNRKKRSVNCEVLDEVYEIVREVEEERRKVRYILESDVQSRTMAGALSENAPRPVSVVAVGGATVDNARSNQLSRPQVCIVIFISLFVTLLCVKLGMRFVDLTMMIYISFSSITGLLNALVLGTNIQEFYYFLHFNASIV